MDILFYIAAGAAVGLAIGLTGVGGGSLMTPLLIMFGFPYNVAIGTDLLYAAITKAGGMASHAKRKTVEWRVVGFLAAGSLPTSIVTALFLNSVFTDSS
ncbi:sulfite exporter TauE/SafE family protein, partial [Porticoccaceae bacterium]|nr:sulfite exporter TauE/SafE family protein [Porticoccaceae bacterium]